MDRLILGFVEEAPKRRKWLPSQRNKEARERGERNGVQLEMNYCIMEFSCILEWKMSYSVGDALTMVFLYFQQTKFDEFASLPAIVPQGPIAILGLGAGTAAHLMLDLWPSRRVEGWEIDGILIDIAREYFALSDLERCTQANGSLSVHIGDALSPSAEVEGGFAGIIVDLFSDGKILPQLQEVTTWLDIEKKLMPHGRIMVNCGGAQAEITESGYIKVNGNISSKGSWVQNSTIQAMYRAFPGKLSWKRMEGQTSGNYLALTGPVLDLDAWSATLPHPLDVNVKDWRPCKLAG